jgi:acetyl esterase/lipase
VREKTDRKRKVKDVSMPFADLPHQPPMMPEAERYAAWCREATTVALTQTRHVLDIAYGPDSWQKIDLYLPKASSGVELPTLLFMHGGYWTHGYKRWLGFMAPAFVSLPAIFISVGYRLAPAAPYPAALADCLSALALTYKHIPTYGGSPRRLFIGGHSAGGHLAALVALRPSLLPAYGLPDNAISACFPVSGVYDLTGPIPQDRLQAFIPQGTDPLVASPLNYTDGNRIPFLLAVGEHDFPVLYEQAYAMDTALRQADGPVEFIEIAGADHFQISQYGGDAAQIWVQRARAWMQDNATSG